MTEFTSAEVQEIVDLTFSRMMAPVLDVVLEGSHERYGLDASIPIACGIEDALSRLLEAIRADKNKMIADRN